MELHHFSDASLAGYGTCTYLRVQDQQDNVHCSLVMAKARVAPIKVMTVLRLELSAALVAAEVSTVLKKELHLPITREVFWTDSKVVLGYLNNDARKFHIFVANRIQKIKQLTRPEQWHYVPSNMNPADHASRGMSTSEITTTRWLTGPAFLWKKEPETPNQPKFELQAGDPEVRTKTTLATQAAIPFDWNARLTHCSTWDHAIRAVARVGRWRKGSKTQEPLSVEELEKAEMIVIKGLQAQTFLQERTHLSENVTLPKSSSLHQLDPIVQDSLIRVGGRLKHASMPNHERHPVVLPKRGHVTNLIIDHCHKRTAHQGRGMMQNELRKQGYWILGGSRTVATRIHRCITCRKTRRPLQEQKMADLPKERVTPSPPFTYTGMDVFGPFVTKTGRKEVKRYGLIFTCYCSRAVHIEMIDDLSTDAFLNGL